MSVYIIPFSVKIRVADVEYAVLSRQTLQVVNAAVYLQALALRDNQGYIIVFAATVTGTVTVLVHTRKRLQLAVHTGFLVA